MWNLGRCAFLTIGPLVAINGMGGELAWGTIAQGGPVGALVGALIGLRLRRPVTVVDTGGLVSGSAAGMAAQVRAQAQQAIGEADLILY